MTEAHSQTAMGQIIADAIQQGIARALELIEAYQSCRGWDDEKTFRFAKTLLADMAAICLRNINDLSDHKISTWVSLKVSIIQQFRPTNTIIQLREQLHSLAQKTTISEYIKEFLTIRLGIFGMSDDEAVDKFTRGLKNKYVRAQIRVLYPQIFESSRMEHGPYQLPGFNSNSSINTDAIDDPIDLSARRDVPNFVQTKYASNNRGRGAKRGGRGSRGGGYRGIFRGTRGGRGGYGGFQGESRGTRGNYHGARGGYANTN
ncbi:hypothetical protein INT47_006715 [Mucor saturninus]|uniref:Retrotransposon gag domain-containing protein n=1 Tax=Mucor saturninus TaxID=64648 RepID=A0A8H7UQ33_9FUNG|nr:hypothetical protein INT47_006715 [Mucor saturninus]